MEDNRASLLDLMRQSRHRSVAFVIGYVAAEDLWWNNVTEGVFRRAGPQRQQAPEHDEDSGIAG